MELKKIGEFGLIDLIRKKVYTKDKRVVLNIGDDAAILKCSSDKLLVFTTDTLMERVHFDLRYFSFRDVGWKSMAANLSDMAAMGGIPLAGLVSLGLPKKTRVEQVLKLYSGMKSLCSKFRCPIIGGDIFSSPGGLAVTICLLGEVEKNLYKTRAGARAGDLIYVTGDLGEAEAGLRILRDSSKKEKNFIRKFACKKTSQTFSQNKGKQNSGERPEDNLDDRYQRWAFFGFVPHLRGKQPRGINLCRQNPD